jgi:uncharacterized membrane protein HdeD (DUF308 family)
MSSSSVDSSASLHPFYFLRAGVAFAWVALAVALGGMAASGASVLLAVYMAWDALANVLDARRTGSAMASGQRTNAAISTVAALVALAGVAAGFTVSVVAFGLWAFAAGALQLLVAWRRRQRAGGQWFLVVSGAQSALAGIHFTVKGITGPMTLKDLVPYAAFGATYFTLAAIVALVRSRRPAAALAA